MMQDRAIVTMEGEYETIHNFQLVPFLVTFNDNTKCQGHDII